jgi:hypothetical protein
LLRDVVVLNSLALVDLRLVSPTLGGRLAIAAFYPSVHLGVIVLRGERLTTEIMLAVINDLLVRRYFQLPAD